jgi:hypothetical protein
MLSFYCKSGNMPFKGTRVKANGRLTASVQTRAACGGLKPSSVNQMRSPNKGETMYSESVPGTEHRNGSLTHGNNF